MGLVIVLFIFIAVTASTPVVLRRLPRMDARLLAILPLLTIGYLLALLPAATGHRPLLVHSSATGPTIGLLVDGLAIGAALVACGLCAVVLIGGSRRSIQRSLVLLLVTSTCAIGLALVNNLVLAYLLWEGLCAGAWLMLGAARDERPLRWPGRNVVGGSAIALIIGLILLYESAASLTPTELIAFAAGAVQEDGLYVPILLLLLVGILTRCAMFVSAVMSDQAASRSLTPTSLASPGFVLVAALYLLARLNPVIGGTDAWFIAFIAISAVLLLVAIRGHRIVLSLVRATVNSVARRRESGTGLPHPLRSLARIAGSDVFPFYLLLVLIPIICIVVMPLLTEGTLRLPWEGLTVHTGDVALAGIVLCVAIVSLVTATRITAIVATGAVGLTAALVAGGLGARHLAMMQLLAETLFLMLLIVLLPKRPKIPLLSRWPAVVRSGFVTVTSGALVAAVMLAAMPYPQPEPWTAYAIARGHGADYPFGPSEELPFPSHLPRTVRFGRIETRTVLASSQPIIAMVHVDPVIARP